MQSTDIMIHINESLTENKQQELESELRSVEGVIALVLISLICL